MAQCQPPEAGAGLEGDAPEFLLAVVVLVAVLALDTLPAIVLGVIISLGILTYRLSFPKTSELGRDRATGSFESRSSMRTPNRSPAWSCTGSRRH